MLFELKQSQVYKISLNNDGYFGFTNSNSIYAQYYSTVVSNGNVVFKFIFLGDVEKNLDTKSFSGYSAASLVEMNESDIRGLFRVYWSEIDEKVLQIEATDIELSWYLN